MAKKPTLGELAFMIGKRMEGNPDYEKAKAEAAEREKAKEKSKEEK